MRVLLVGGGGREHALARAMSRYRHTLYFTHPNPGFSGLGAQVDGGIVEAAEREHVDLVVVGPEGPLAEGIVDTLTARGIAAFGPTRSAARLETSKVFCKQFAVRHGLPTPSFQVIRSEEEAEVLAPGVVKLDGLAAGKGVWVCDSVQGTRQAIKHARILRPEAPVLLEERVSGREISVLAISDGQNIVGLPPARDHKRRFNHDAGPNTGGMGAVAPVLASDVPECISLLQRAVRGMAADGMPFRGVLYGGFMLTEKGPSLLEFNVRFGDPECQAILPLFAEDPVPWFHGAAVGRLPGPAIALRPGYACCVVVVGEEYPEGVANGPIRELPQEADDLIVFQAGTREVGRELWAVGGRVLGITGLGLSPEKARNRAYQGVAQVSFQGAAWRGDIGSGSWG